MTIYNVQHRDNRKTSGVIIGSAVGDALGAPFEFGPPDQYTSKFPHPVLTGHGEMIGGGTFGWDPGQFTDDTEMAIILGRNIVKHIDNIDNLDNYDAFLEDTFRHFKAWAERATDVGGTTSAALSGDDWRTGAKNAHERNGFSASNGCVMRIAPVGVLASTMPKTKAFEIAVLQARLTHWDPVAACCAAIASEVIANGIVGTYHNVSDYIQTATASALSVADEFLRSGEHGQNWFDGFDRDDVAQQLEQLRNFQPDAHTPRNGTALICLGQALWAVAGSSSFEDALIRTINLGYDTDTVAAVAGAIAGAFYGADMIPARWQGAINGDYLDIEFHSIIDGQPMSVIWDLDRLQELAWQINNHSQDELSYSFMEPAVGPTEVAPNLFAANLPAVLDTDLKDFSLVTLCRPMAAEMSDCKERNYFYMIDRVHANPNLHHVLEEAIRTINVLLDNGRKVIVHCHAGRSRTGFVLKAWYMRQHSATHDEAHQWLSAIWPTYDPDGNDDFSTLLDTYR